MRRGQQKGQQLNPIARWEPIGGAETLLMDTYALMLHLGISARTVRRYRGHQVAVDETTGAPLYDAFAVGVERQNVQPRASGRPGALRAA